MKVRVFPPPLFCDASVVDEDNFMDLPEGATLIDVYKGLKIPIVMRKILICTVNYKKEKMNKKLCDQDVINFFRLSTGG
jgi:hypothetical protein